MTQADLDRRVFFEETDKALRVVRACRVCESSCGPIDLDHPMIVSGLGLVHCSKGYGETCCGKDATGDGWWWRL